MVADTDDQPGFAGTVRVDEATCDDAVATRQVQVRVLPGSSTVWRVEGETRSNLGLVITVVADLSLLVLVLLLLRFGSRLRQEMVLVAAEDLERCPPGSVLDQVDGLRFVVCGEVEVIEDDAVVLDLGDRRVRVVLDGRPDPAGYQQPVRATGTMRSSRSPNRLPFRIVKRTTPRHRHRVRGRRACGPDRAGVSGAGRGPALRVADRHHGTAACTSTAPCDIVTAVNLAPSGDRGHYRLGHLQPRRDGPR